MNTDVSITSYVGCMWVAAGMLYHRMRSTLSEIPLSSPDLASDDSMIMAVPPSTVLTASSDVLFTARWPRTTCRWRPRWTRCCVCKHSSKDIDGTRLQRYLAISPLYVLLGVAATPASSRAADTVYNNAAGSDAIRNIFGAVYILLLTFFVGKLFIRRANQGKTEVRKGVSTPTSLVSLKPISSLDLLPGHIEVWRCSQAKEKCPSGRSCGEIRTSNLTV